MLVKTFTLLFYLKRRANYSSGELPIYMQQRDVKAWVVNTRTQVTVGCADGDCTFRRNSGKEKSSFKRTHAVH